MGVYHIDGKTHGPSLGPDDATVERFALFKRPDVPSRCGKPRLANCDHLTAEADLPRARLDSPLRVYF